MYLGSYGLFWQENYSRNNFPARTGRQDLRKLFVAPAQTQNGRPMGNPAIIKSIRNLLPCFIVLQEPHNLPPPPRTTPIYP